MCHSHHRHLRHLRHLLVHLSCERFELCNGDVQSPSGGIVFLLDIVTCGIYGLYWCYKAGDKLDRIKQQWGIPSSNTGILYLILSLLGLDIVVWALVQNEVNGMTGGAAA